MEWWWCHFVYSTHHHSVGGILLLWCYIVFFCTLKSYTSFCSQNTQYWIHEFSDFHILKCTLGGTSDMAAWFFMLSSMKSLHLIYRSSGEWCSYVVEKHVTARHFNYRWLYLFTKSCSNNSASEVYIVTGTTIIGITAGVGNTAFGTDGSHWTRKESAAKAHVTVPAWVASSSVTVVVFVREMVVTVWYDSILRVLYLYLYFKPIFKAP